MRKVLILFVILFQGFNLCAKDHGQVKDGSFIWQKIYTTKLGASESKKKLLLNLKMNDLRNYPLEIAYEMNDAFIYSDNSHGVEYNDVSVSAHVRIEFKQHRYRVTVSDLVLKHISRDREEYNVVKYNVVQYNFEYKYVNRINNFLKYNYDEELQGLLNDSFDKIFTISDKDRSTW
ncbi:hypothetical protein K5X82_03635 [Halosquirtibacter xylanolyticus]|uniref:hypothetical protein n=1 Tax=Halosquirtibacter xylanolyticus TaxID=3374599 RepID=UPI00374A8815|nr:hypothetical protein K5X82_03635 [Prolixibacteraceae bacterium]